MIEIARLNVSMTSTSSASDLLKSFASLVLTIFGSVSALLAARQRIRELLRFICGLRLLGCQIALVLNGKLVDTVGDMLVDLTQSDLHVVERFLARDIVDLR